MIFAFINIFDIGPVLSVVFVMLPLVAAGVGIWLIWTGLERKSWWPLRLAAGAPLIAYGAAALFFSTL